MNKQNLQRTKALRLYSFVLQFYPTNYRRAFGSQKLQTFQDYYDDVVREQGRLGLKRWLTVLGDEVNSMISEHLTALQEATNKMGKQMSATRQWLVGVGTGIGLIALILLGGPPGMLPALVLLVAFSALGLIVVWLFGTGVARLTHTHPAFAARLDPLKKRWRVAAGMAITLAAVSTIAVVQTATQPVVSCATRQGSTSKPPTSLITAQDYFAMGDYEYDQGNCDAAIAAYTRSIELDPSLAEAYNNRAYTLMVKQDYADALPDLDHAIALRPTYINALMNRGDIYNYYYHIDYARAIADYDRVLALGADAYRQTSLCGHRLLAQTQGWKLSTFVQVFTRGPQSGCESASPAN